MNLRPDIHTALFIAIVSILTLYAWRGIGGFLASSSGTETVGKAMVSVTG
jgi:hypothetical protein